MITVRLPASRRIRAVGRKEAIMRREKDRPSWWHLYVLGLAIVGLLVLGALAPTSERGHQAAAMGAVLLACGLVEVWLRANRRALLHIEGLTLVQRSGPDVIHRAPAEERQPAQGSRQPPAEAVAVIPTPLPPLEAERKEVSVP
jgi:hypothetical protein